MFSGSLKLSDDDDDFVLESENSHTNLSNIFGVSVENSLKKETPSLRYVSPKQTNPIAKTASSDNSQDWKVQVAKVVTAYKLLNQENISQGKIGFAILKNAEDQLRIILYRSKNNVLSTSTLKDDSKIYRNNLYLQFSDDLQLFWSILFELDDMENVLDFIGSRINVETQQKNDVAEESVKPIRDKAPAENSSDEKIKDTKASILSRMAKMGQPLPKLSTVTTTDLSDSSDVESRTKVVQKPIINSRKPKAQPLVASNMQIIPSTSLGGLVPYSNANLIQVQDSQYVNILLAENRTQNTELRMNISKLETKIEKVLDRIDIIGHKTADERRDSKEDEILELEEKILDLKKQNRSLKVQLREIEDNPSKKDTSLRDDLTPFTQLLEHYQINQDQNSLSDIYKQLIQNMSGEIDSCNNSVKHNKETIDDLNKKLKSTNLELEQTKLQLNEERTKHGDDIETCRQELFAVKHKYEELSKLQQEEKQSSEVLVKEIMNNLYQRLSQKFEENETFSAIEVTKICASAIKIETNNVIKKK